MRQTDSDLVAARAARRAGTAREPAGGEALAVSSSEILILPGGNILAHNLSARLARVLAKLNPQDAAMKQRGRRKQTLGK